MACQWSVCAPQPMSKAGDGSAPSCRYGHGAVVYGSSMVVTHGYYFDQESGGAHFLDDTWAFDAGTKTWARWVVAGPAPAARFWLSVAASADEYLYAFGGTDGGARRNGGELAEGHGGTDRAGCDRPK